MNINAKTRRYTVATISYATALLFIYAATSKILDFENFQVQLGQSPMISAFAVYVSYAVPITEIIISLLLISSKGRMVGLILFYGLMAMFTSYIYIILNYSSFIPCSCGGLLEELSWNQHIVFNLVFMVFPTIGIYAIPSKNILLQNVLRKSATIFFITITSFGLVYLLFLWSEKIMQYHNTFVRRFPHFPAVLEKEIRLTSDKFYFAGADTANIFLGDYTAPLKIVEVSPDGVLTKQSVQLNRVDLPFTSIQLKVAPPYFYLVDGNVPAVFKGKISDWKADYVLRGQSYFSTIQPVDSTALLFRAVLIKSKTNTIGKIKLSDTSQLFFAPHLIEKQLDGVFDTDGQLHFDDSNKKMVYLYTHRNEYIVADKNLQLLHRGNTIDTITTADLKVVTVKSNGETKLAAPPLIVNKCSSLHKNLLFVNSQLPGQFESLEMWKKASIIDVYNIEEKKYLLSFYFYDVDQKKLRNLYVVGNKMYGLINDKLLIYNLRKSVIENYKY